MNDFDTVAVKQGKVEARRVRGIHWGEHHQEELRKRKSESEGSSKDEV
jgi:hypothetical protein